MNQALGRGWSEKYLQGCHPLTPRLECYGVCVCACVCVWGGGGGGVAPYYRGTPVWVCRWVKEAGPCASENDTRGACTGALRVRHPHLGQSLWPRGFTMLLCSLAHAYPRFALSSVLV